MKKLLIGAMTLTMVASLFALSTDADAATYGMIKELISNQEMALPNERLQRVMTQAEAEEFVLLMDQLIAENGGVENPEMWQQAMDVIAEEAAAQGEAVLPTTPVETAAPTTDAEETDMTVASEAPVVEESATEDSQQGLVEQIIGAITYPFEVLATFFTNLF